MRRIISLLIGMITISPASSQNWIRVSYENQDVKGIPFSKVRIKKGDTKEAIFSKDMQVSLSEKPDGIESGYYVVHARNGYIADGDKKNKIEIGSDKITRTSDGWYEYDFGKNLYVRKVGLFVGTEHCDPIYILPIGEYSKNTTGKSTTSSQNSSSSSQAGTVENRDGMKYFDHDMYPNKREIFDDNGLKAITTPELPFDNIKPITEETSGWNLVATNQIKHGNYPVTVKRYENDTNAYCVLFYPDGSFMTALDNSEGDYSLLPNPREEAIGWFRIKCDGYVLEGKNGGFCRFIYPTGLFAYTDKFTPHYGMTADLFYRSRNSSDDWIRNLEFYSFSYFVLPEEPTASYPIVKVTDGYKLTKLNFIKGNKKYRINEAGWAEAYMQSAPGGNRFYYANDKDSIVRVEESGHKEIIYYSNGDEVELDREKGSVNGKPVVTRANLHRNGGDLKVQTINGSPRTRLTLSNGDVFTGSFKMNEELSSWEVIDDPYSAFVEFMLSDSELTPWKGSWNRNGEIELIVDGMNKAEKERQDAAKKAAEEAENRKQYNNLCNQFGKKYVDAALAGRPIVGMPEKLFLAAFNASKETTSNGSTLYRVYGFGVINGFSKITITDRKLKWSIWVSSGRISYITYYD